MRPLRRFRPFLLMLPFLLLALAGGCARQPPSEGGSQSARSGKLIRVTLKFAQAVDALPNGREIGERTAEPAVVDVKHTAAGSLLSDGILRLLLGTNK